MQKIVSIILAIIMFLVPTVNIPNVEVDETKFKTEYTNVFVHGLGGWGEYDQQYKFMPYWGMFGGDLMKYLNARGFKSVAASVMPTGSAWDRACELYAQLTGTVTDYGREHSERCHHARYGTDFTGNALVEKISATDKINLYGHSFGGATVLMFLELLANGSEAEKNATSENELSDFFKGGKAEWVNSIVTLAAPMNGTTAYNVQEEIEVDPNATLEEKAIVFILSNGTAAPDDGRIADDSAAYDMYIDNAIKMCEGFETLKNVYYFSIPCAQVTQNEDGTYSPVTDKMEFLFKACSARMGKYTGTTKGGYVIDASWQMNDGLVPTISAKAPFNAPQKDFDENNITKGIWNVMPTYEGDHMSLEGGLLKTNNVRELYVDLLSMINGL